MTGAVILAVEAGLRADDEPGRKGKNSFSGQFICPCPPNALNRLVSCRPLSDLFPMDGRGQPESIQMQMNWQQYQARCSAPNGFSRFALETSIGMLGAASCRTWLLQILQTAVPVQKPAGHLGGPQSDFFLLQLSRPQVAELLRSLDPGRCSLAKGKAEHLLVCWREYLDFLPDSS